MTAARAHRQLWLVDAQAQRPTDDPARQVFEHWAEVLGKNPRRCAFGPSRRQVVQAWLRYYDADVLMAACDGCAADAWANGDNDSGREFNDLTHILANEERIERYAAAGERLRQQADAWAARQQGQGAGSACPQAAQQAQADAHAARQRLRAYLHSRRG